MGIWQLLERSTAELLTGLEISTASSLLDARLVNWSIYTQQRRQSLLFRHLIIAATTKWPRTALASVRATERLDASNWQTKDSVAALRLESDWRTGSVQLANQGQRGCVQSRNGPPACSEYWPVHWLPASPRPLYVEAVREDCHAPGRGTLVMMTTVIYSFSYLFIVVC